MAFDDDDITTDSNTVTTLEFQTQQSYLLKKQKELDRQIQNLDDGSSGNFRNLDLHDSSPPNSDEVSTATSNVTGVTANNASYGGTYPPPYGAYPPPYGAYPPPYAYPPYGHVPLGPGGPNKSGGPQGGPPPHMPSWGATPQLVPAQDDSRLFQMLSQKEDELKELRSKYDESQSKLQTQSIELSRLQSKLEQAIANLKQERKIAKLEAEASANERLEKLLESQRKEHRDTMKQMQEQMSQAAAAIALASQEAPPPPVTSRSHPSIVVEANSASDNTGVSKNDRDYDTVKSFHTEDNKKLPTHKFEKARDLPSQPTDLSVDENLAFASELEEPPSTFILKSEPKESVSITALEDDPRMVAPQKVSKPWDQNYIDTSNSVVDEVSTGGNMNNALKGYNNIVQGSVNSANNSSEEKDQFDVQDSKNLFTPKYSDPDEQQPILDDDNRSLGQTVASSTYGEDRQKVINKTLLDPYGDKGCYTGVVLRTTGMPHGLGRMVYEEDGRIYEGDWRHGRWHGYGRASFSNGDAYEGEYKFDQRHGRGVYRWNDGRIYDGQFSEDKRHGHGVFTWPDGAVYDGEFNDGQRQGHGKYTFADGGCYEGGWKDGRYSGFGTCTWEDGRRYRGEWRNGMAHGRGTETYPNGAIRHEGEWVDDEPVR